MDVVYEGLKQINKPRTGASFFCDDGDESTGSIRSSETLDQLSNYQRSKEICC
jgi:hypothetical protein